MKRRGFLRGSAAALALVPGGVALTEPALAETALTSSEAVIATARALANAPYLPRPQALPPPFDALSYDSHRAIRPIEGRAARLPLGHEFRADLLPPGWLFPDPVTISFAGERPAPVFGTGLFEFDPRYFPQPPAARALPDAGFSGLRLLYPLNAADRLDELIVFQGASYFRALARDAVYGLSARALALGTGGAAPEEFPVTRQIAILDTDPGRVTLGCVIDSPRAACALIAAITPGRAGAPETVMDSALHLFARETITDAGIAPLTSMFQHSDMGPAGIDDFRPAVHDSDVLVIDNGAGERLWRPLANPAKLQMSAFADHAPRRFGLVQTADHFDRFRDGEAAYHRRPSAMVEPAGDWGAGAVMLLEIPTIDEFADNIAVFWRPDAPLEPGQEHRFAYRLRWQPAGLQSLPEADPPLALVPMRHATGIEPGLRGARRFVIDYAPPAGSTPPAPDRLALMITAADGADISGQTLHKLAGAPDTLRASFLLTPDAALDRAELRVDLRHREGMQTAGAAAPVWLWRWGRGHDGGP
ncbi:MAG: glucan biosynthesis protein G [Rhodobacteraceae bacterium]|nr:MAG: glucan biosynthesis protein G [Paracoccaceae bacterium]